MILLPVADWLPSLTLVAIVKLVLYSGAGVKMTPASNVFTSAMGPEAVHTPLTKVEVTLPDVPVLRLPAAVVDSVNVAVTLALSASDATMSVRFSGVSSVNVSAADRFVAVGASFAEVPVMFLLPV